MIRGVGRIYHHPWPWRVIPSSLGPGSQGGNVLIMSESIKEYWDAYFELVVSTSAAETQVKETKLAFYSGAPVMLEIMMKVIDEYSKEEADIIMQNLYKEYVLFVKNNVFKNKQK